MSDEKFQVIARLSSQSLIERLSALSLISNEMTERQHAEPSSDVDNAFPPKRVFKTLIPVFLQLRATSPKEWRLRVFDFLSSILVARPDVFEHLMDSLKGATIEKQSQWAIVGFLEICLIALRSPGGYNKDSSEVSRPLLELIGTCVNHFDRLGTSLPQSQLRPAVQKANSLLFAAFQHSQTIVAAVDIWKARGYIIPLVMISPLVAQAEVLELFTTKVLLAKTPANEFTVSLFKNFLESLSDELWSDLCLQMVKTLKKSPESASMLAAFVLQCVKNDLSSIASDGLLMTLIRMLKSETKIVRERAVSIMQSCALKCRDPSALSALVLSGLDGCLGI